VHNPRVVLILSLIAATPAFGQPNLTVTALPDRYVTGGRSFDDLDRLAAEAARVKPGSITLLACVPGSVRSYKAAVHRFRHLPVESVVLRANSAACSPAALAPAALAGGGPRPAGVDDDAVEAYWRELAP